MFSFQKRVFEVVKKIPTGKFLTYRMVAKLAGRPKAWRAVGNILNKNTDLYPPKFSKKTWESKIPCHRVIRSDDRVGGYRYGIKRKIILLRKEGIIINSDGKVTSRFRK